MKAVTLDEGLLKGISDADEVSSLVDTVGSSVGPCPHRQEVKEVAVVIKGIEHPGTTFVIPPWRSNMHKSTSVQTHSFICLRAEKKNKK